MRDGDRHECEPGRTLRGKRDDLRFSVNGPPGGEWILSGQTFGDEEVMHVVTYCPWCGVRLPVGLASWPDPAELLRSVGGTMTADRVAEVVQVSVPGAPIVVHEVRLTEAGRKALEIDDGREDR